MIMLKIKVKVSVCSSHGPTDTVGFISYADLPAWLGARVVTSGSISNHVSLSVGGVAKRWLTGIGNE